MKSFLKEVFVGLPKFAFVDVPRELWTEKNWPMLAIWIISMMLLIILLGVVALGGLIVVDQAWVTTETAEGVVLEKTIRNHAAKTTIVPQGKGQSVIIASPARTEKVAVVKTANGEIDVPVSDEVFEQDLIGKEVSYTLSRGIIFGTIRGSQLIQK